MNYCHFSQEDNYIFSNPAINEKKYVLWKSVAGLFRLNVTFFGTDDSDSALAAISGDGCRNGPCEDAGRPAEVQLSAEDRLRLSGQMVAAFLYQFHDERMSIGAVADEPPATPIDQPGTGTDRSTGPRV